MSEEEKNIDEKLPKKRSWIKRLFKGILYTVLGILILNLILYAVLSIPAVQQRVIDFAIGQIKPIIKTEVSIDKVRISLFNNVNLQGVYVEDQSKDTLLYANDLNVKLSIWGLLNNKVELKAIDIDEAFVNISQQTPDAPFNFQFIIEAFSDSTKKDSSENAMEVTIDNIEIKNSRINYNVLSEPQTPGIFNPSHIAISQLNTRLKLPSIDILKLNAEVVSLSFIEKSGLEIKNIEAKAQSLGTKMWTDKLKITLPNSKIELDSLQYNFFDDTYLINGNVNLSPSDLAIFMPKLREFKHNFNLQTSISGKLPEINIKDITLNNGEELKLQAKAFISDYEHYDKSKINAIISQFRISPQAITKFAQLADSSFIAPDILSSIGSIRMNGKLDGQLNNLNLNVEAWIKQGSVELTSHISVTDTSFQNYRVNAHLQTFNFNIGQLVGTESKLGKLSADTKIDLVSETNKLSANIRGTINSLQYDTVRIKGIHFKAGYNPRLMSASLNASLPIGKVIAKASMTQEQNPQIKFDLDIHNLKVDRFYQNPSWENPQLSFCLNGSLRGNSIDNIEGIAYIDSLHFWGDNFKYKPDRITLQSAFENRSRFIDLKSSLLSVRIDGQYKFETLPDEFSNMMHDYLPGIFDYNKRIKKYGNNMNIDIDIYNSETLSNLFNLPIAVIEPIKIQSVINTMEDKIKVDADIPHLQFGTNNIKGSSIHIANSNQSLDITATSRLIQRAGDLVLNLTNNAKSDTINTVFSFKNENPDMNIVGELIAASHFHLTKKGDLQSYLQFKPSRISVKDLSLSFLPARIENKGERTTISNFGFMVGHGRMVNKYFAVDGAISNQKEDTLNVNFTNARLANILSAFDINNISATANGDIRLTNLLENSEFYTKNLQIRDIIIFNDTLGTMNVESHKDNINKAIDLNVTLGEKEKEASRIHGLMYIAENKLDLNVDLEKLSIKWLHPFMADMLNQVEGSVSSRINIKGAINSPKADGWFGFNDTYLGVDFTNVTYHINDTIKVMPDRVGFRNLIIEDNNKNKATASALFDYAELSNPKFLLNLDLNNFMVLNTNNRTDSLYYGKLMASGNVKIRGDMDNIKVDMNIRNEKHSTINITIPEVSEAYDYQGVVFINVPEQDSTQRIEQEQPLPLNLDMDLTVDPEIILGLAMNSDNPLQMQMKGRGNIKFNYDMEADKMNTFGNYIITDGTVKIRPQNIKTLVFRIKEGSRLNLTGDPMKTTFDLTAYYRVNVALSTLDKNFSPSKIPVNCVLGIKGNINKMELTYNVELPSASDDVRQKVEAMINTDEQRIRQFGNLILFNSFYSSTGSGSDSNMLGAIASSTISGGLNALFGSLLGNNWQIGTNIETSDGSFSDADVSVNASTTLFDDRLTFSTNLGYRSDQAVDNNFIGDFDVEYQLSNTIRLKAYTHTNDKFYKQAATTQGVGIVYSKEAKTIKELFRFFRKKNNNKNKEKEKH